MSEGASKAHEKRKIQAIKGVRDILPPETALWNRVEQTAHEVFATYGFGEIRLPIFEQTDLFARSIGAETDVVSKEMYTFEDHDLLELEQVRAALILWKSFGINELSDFSSYERNVLNYLGVLSERFKKGDVPKTAENEGVLRSIREMLDRMNDLISRQSLQSQSDVYEEAFEQCLTALKIALRSFRFGDVLSLRPEATASVCRAYIEHGMHTLPGNVKLYYMGPMFRRERPQKGRYRQFYQIGVEVLGQSVHFATDAEVIAMLMEFFDRCGLSGHTLFINSIGCKNCRPTYVALLRRELLKVRNNLSPESQRRIETNPLRVFDSKAPEDQDRIKELPTITANLCAECRADYDNLKTVLRSRGINFEENPRLVRGLDYYTRTTFEVTAPGLGAQDAICGGGRYEGLVELLGGPKFAGIKGTGFAIGEDRLIDAVKDSGRFERVAPAGVYIAWMGQEPKLVAQDIARLLRRNGISVEVPEEEMKLGKSLSLAYRRGATYALIIGEDEVASGQFTLKRLSDSAQKKVTQADLNKVIRHWET